MTAYIKIEYIFTFSDRSKVSHLVIIDPESLELVEDEVPTDAWCRLENHQCPNCPLNNQHSFCPAAQSVAMMAKSFTGCHSYDPVQITVNTSSRTISREGTLQEGIQSLMGLRMAASGCPVMEKLKPMVRFHLPFADTSETIYRAISMYLVSQFIRMKKGWAADFDLNDLQSIYEDIHQLNLAFSKRLRQASEGDANVNGICILDIFAQQIPWGIEHALDDLQPIFNPYLHP
ncbi:MAG: hypothetical protein HJJLKODD_02790 [Phycisphaerae bacterium]|nr:hypothetical protein [Phycisphaerae bacterium]